jgi:ferredoxin
MPKKYHIHIKETLPRYHPIGKYSTIEFREECAGSCKRCVKKQCVYGIFTENFLHMSAMEEPEYLYTCMSCFRCVQECTKGIFQRVVNPDYRILGNDYWRPETLHRLWYQAHTGKVPVSGAGYRGPFVGPGFDSMWTDMSEIVRPTRDGIHGREYINTSIELSRKKMKLEFDSAGKLTTELLPINEIPLPLIYTQPPYGLLGDHIMKSIAVSAGQVGTKLIADAEEAEKLVADYNSILFPRLSVSEIDKYADLIARVSGIELSYEPAIEKVIRKLRSESAELIILIGIPLDKDAVSRTVELSVEDVDLLHYYADDDGNELNTASPKFIKDLIRDVHLALVENSIRDKVNLIFSGGIAMAEHMAKAIICGADGVTADLALLVALECRLCDRCKTGKSCPSKLEEFDVDWGAQRVTNLVGSWHSQLLELMGAMGIREARRLRGEVGRSMWFEDLEKENFAPVFGEKKVQGLG